MQYKFITTSDNNILYCCLLDKSNKLIELHPFKNEENKIVGNIYIGKIVNIVKNINAAFINIGLDKEVFLQLENGQHYIYTSEKPSTKIPQIGDELLVQITKEAYGSKMATATSMISIAGNYAVLTYKKSFVGISNKIKEEKERKRLKDIFQSFVTDDYGFIVRTNASGIAVGDLVNETNELVNSFNKLIANIKYLKPFQCIYKQPPYFIQLIRDLYKNTIEEYIFDDENLYNETKTYFENHNMLTLINKIRLYEDETYTLFKLYNLKSKIDKALHEKVWLKSGANLIIQSTEALYVIDVNTSKAINKKRDFEETVYQINLEAAKEIAAQIRLRNLSGIIIIDFIDMKNKENKLNLINQLNSFLQKDRVKTTLVGMTRLGLVEITRKKIGKSLLEQIKSLNENPYIDNV